MKNFDTWVASKFELGPRGNWRASRENVKITSRVAADRAAQSYEDALKSFAQGRLLDLGCGTVPLFGMYSPYVSEVTCVDWASGPHNKKHVDIFADLNEPLTLGSSAYNTVVASDVLEHLHSPQSLFETAANALKPEGHLIIGVPFLYWLHEQPYDFHRYTEFALRRLSDHAGFDVVQLEAWAGAPEVVCDILGKSLASWPVASKLMCKICSFLLTFELTKKLSRATRATMPLGYTLVARRR